eukprot:2810873-Amphidinium_carterae.1
MQHSSQFGPKLRQALHYQSCSVRANNIMAHTAARNWLCASTVDPNARSINAAANVVLAGHSKHQLGSYHNMGMFKLLIESMT